MTSPLVEARPPETTQEAIEPDEAMARRNMLWGWALVGLFLLLFGATVGIAYVYLWLD